MGQSGEKIPRNIEMRNLTSPATVLSRCCSVSFPPHSPRSMAHGLAGQHFSSYEELDRFMDLIERWKIFLPRDSPAVREMGQSGS
nr:hypothetical transcript [Hymenolepis microstoma]CUU97432.1 hypothetical transcript [Hymenolepis microstoma]